MNNNNYFPHFYNDRNEKKLKFLMNKYGTAQAYYWYFSLKEILIENLSNELEFSGLQKELIYSELGITDINLFNQFILDLVDLQLFKIENNKLSCFELQDSINRMKKISITRSDAAKQRYKKNLQIYTLNEIDDFKEYDNDESEQSKKQKNKLLM